MTIRWDKKGRMIFLKPYKVKVHNIQFSFPKGFKSDGASIPWYAQWFGDPYDGDTLDGALVHDGLYGQQGHCILGGTEIVLPRLNVDNIFRGIMGWQHVNPFKKWIYWAMVRMFGWMPWHISPLINKWFLKHKKSGIMIRIIIK